MKVLVLASGGDAPGMNKFIARLYKKFRDNLFACKFGFKGLVENDIHPASTFQVLKYENCAGCCIKSSRFPEFKEEKYFKKAVKNAQIFDVVVVLGGNGSQRGALELQSNGVNTIFVPATIDNDVEGSEYSIGFHTAVKEACHAVYSIMPSMDALNRTCIFEVMGRDCPAIAEVTAEVVCADMLIANKKDLNISKLAKIIRANEKDDKSTLVIIRENIINLSELIKNLSDKLKSNNIKGHVVGHVQRGGEPTKHELEMANYFAKETIKSIKNKDFPKSILI